MFKMFVSISSECTKVTIIYDHFQGKVYFIHSSTVCPLYSGFPSPKTKFRHLSLSLVSSSVSPWIVMLRLTPSIHLSLGLHLLRVPSGSHSKTFIDSLFPGILSTCPNHRSRFSSVTSKMFFRTSMTSLLVTFRTFSFLDFLADLLKNKVYFLLYLFNR
jgi:hypothetical protein